MGEMERAAEDSMTEKPGAAQSAKDGGGENIDETEFGIVSRKSGPPYVDRPCYEVVTAWVHPRYIKVIKTQTSAGTGTAGITQSPARLIAVRVIEVINLFTKLFFLQL